MGIIVTFEWDEGGTPTMMLNRLGFSVAISLNDAHSFSDYESSLKYVPRVTSALGLDYWSNLDRHAVLDTIYLFLDDLVSMPPAPMDGLDRQKAMRDAGITHMALRGGGRVVAEAGL